MAQTLFSGNSNYRIDVDAALQSQDIAGNYSVIYWRVIVYKTAGSGYWSGPPNSGSADSNVGGSPDLWSASGFSYDFRNGSTWGEWVFAQGTFVVPHNADGTGVYFVTGAMNLTDLGYAEATTGVRELPRIPRGPRVKVAGVWRNTVAYVKVAGVWKIAIPYVKQGGTWKIGGG